ncbi:hypothetical protein [Clostridium sp. HMP27]|uniref:hypothetical protein n=1 Tax=Clostridium sp. HMP27 TaxID=1487921 RepID=UPI00052DFDF2|nr:hypothetical protein [Clostridium sp. HMP27]KGK86998.1 hypothetical protein DP68_12400 [Clostridium sp. HMP27]
MINKLAYMFKRNRIFYMISFVVVILGIFQGSLIKRLPGIFDSMLVFIFFRKIVENRSDKINVFLGFGVTRKEFYILTIIYDVINSILSSIVITLTKMKIDNIDKSYFIYVFLLYLMLVLVFFSILSFNQIFQHTDYEAITWITGFIYIAIYSGIYSAGFNTNNFISFNEKLVSYKNFTLRQFYIMLIITIAFNYMTSYLVHKGIEIKIKGEVE